MNIRWAAVVVTALFVLMNAGAVIDPAQPNWTRAVGAVLAVAGIAAGLGLALNKPWAGSLRDRRVLNSSEPSARCCSAAAASCLESWSVA